jgi:hypothetical protein
VENDGRENESRRGDPDHEDGPGESAAAIGDPSRHERPGRPAKPTAETNVVRFPKNWFGPTEDLVPFGPRAFTERAFTQDDDPVPAPASADDFWSEASAAIHAALEAPPPEDRGASRRPRRSIGGVRAAAALAFLALAGAGVAGRLLSATGPGTAHRHHVGGGRPAARLSASQPPPALVPRPPTRARRSAVTHRRQPAPSRSRASAVIVRQAPESPTSPSTSAQPESTSYRAPVAATAATAQGSSPSTVSRAGPSGPVSLVGAGTTPSG